LLHGKIGNFFIAINKNDMSCIFCSILRMSFQVAFFIAKKLASKYLCDQQFYDRKFQHQHKNFLGQNQKLFLAVFAQFFGIP